MAILEFPQHSEVVREFRFLDANGQPVDPPQRARAHHQDPNGVEQTFVYELPSGQQDSEITRVSAGVFQFTMPKTSMAGRHKNRYDDDGTVAIFDQVIVIVPSVFFD